LKIVEPYITKRRLGYGIQRVKLNPRDKAVTLSCSSLYNQTFIVTYCNKPEGRGFETQ
jgi:hypothetical protein